MAGDAEGKDEYENTRGGTGIWDTCRVDPDFAHLSLDEIPARVFGYGSLVFRTGFPYLKRRAAVVPHFCRRFWQSSIDHRGTHKFPGRTALLLRESDVQKVEAGTEKHGVAESVGGYVYECDPQQWKEWILRELDIREKNGYTRTIGKAVYDDGSEVDVVVYVGSTDMEMNPAFSYGTLDETAQIIAKAEGPSGKNREYLMNLHAVREISDAYLDDLASRVTAISDSEELS